MESALLNAGDVRTLSVAGVVLVSMRAMCGAPPEDGVVT